MKKINRVLTIEDRRKIEYLLHSKTKHKEIIKEIGIHQSTLYREIRRCRDAYNAEEAQEAVYRSYSFIDFDIIGKRFGLLTVLEFANIYKGRSWWKCRCDCGKECVIARKIMNEYCSEKRPLSCGCIAKQAGGSGKAVPLEEGHLAKFQDLLRFRKIKNKCWIWTGYRQKGKCPRTSFRSRSMSVRRCMYMLINGLTELDENVHTTCGNLYCFNPEHLTLDRPLKRHFYEVDFD